MAAISTSEMTIRSTILGVDERLAVPSAAVSSVACSLIVCSSCRHHRRKHLPCAPPRQEARYLDWAPSYRRDHRDPAEG